VFRRIDAIEEIGDKLRALNPQEASVLAAVLAASDAKPSPEAVQPRITDPRGFALPSAAH
jgi:hypothetical protein